MFLHLGGHQVIPLKGVIAILDAAARRHSRATDECLRAAEAKGLLDPGAGGEVNAYVVTTTRIYPSAISAVTLKKRAGFLEGLGAQP